MLIFDKTKKKVQEMAYSVQVSISESDIHISFPDSTASWEILAVSVQKIPGFFIKSAIYDLCHISFGKGELNFKMGAPMQIFKFGFINFALLFLVSTAGAHEKTWPEKRLKQVWPEAQSFTSKQVSLTSSQVSDLKNKDVQIAAQDRSPTFYFAEVTQEKKAKKIGIIFFVDEIGDNGVIEMSIAMGIDGRVKKIDVWEHSENSLIAKEEFLKQFVGKTSADSFVVNKDYQPVKGAEKASESVARAVKKALKITNTIFEKK